MELIALPLTTVEVAELAGAVTLPHDLLHLEHGLRSGQRLVVEDEDGACWAAEVDGVRFNAHRTWYRFRLGEPVDPVVVEAVTHRSPAWTSGDVAISLRLLARATADAGLHLLSS